MGTRSIVGGLLVLGLALGAPTNRAQELLYARSGTDAPPTWVSTTHALRGVTVDWNLFDSEDRDNLEFYLDLLATTPPDRDSADGCALEASYAIVTPPPDAPDRSSLQGVVTSYRDAFLGRVNSVTPGFYQGILGSLVRLQLQQTLDGTPPPIPTVNAFIEAGTVTLRGRKICKPGARGQLPTPGARLLFFTNQTSLADRDDPVLFLEDEAVFYNTADGVSLSQVMTRQLPEDYHLSFDEFLVKLAQLREQVREGS